MSEADWAEKEAAFYVDLSFESRAAFCRALRKAKADGLREAAKRLHDCGECDASDHEEEFLDEADKIESAMISASNT